MSTWETDAIRVGVLESKLDALDNELPIVYDFGAVPDSRGLDSYRGYYDHLAIGYNRVGDTTVGSLLDAVRYMLKLGILEGYKGGEYILNHDTPVWAANYSKYLTPFIVDVVEENGIVTLVTQNDESLFNIMDRLGITP